MSKELKEIFDKIREDGERSGWDNRRLNSLSKKMEKLGMFEEEKGCTFKKEAGIFKRIFICGLASKPSTFLGDSLTVECDEENCPFMRLLKKK